MTMYQLERWRGLAENGPSNGGPEPGGGPSGGNPEAGAVDPSTGASAGASGGPLSGADDASPDVRAGDPAVGPVSGEFGGQPTSSGSSFATRAGMFSSAARSGFGFPEGLGLTLGIPGIAAVSISRDRLGISAFGVGLSISTKGITLGGSGMPQGGATAPSGGGPSSGFGPGPEGGAGSPGGSDWSIPLLSGLPALAIVSPGSGEGGVGGLGAVTVPWLWLGAGMVGVVLLSRRGQGRRRR